MYDALCLEREIGRTVCRQRDGREESHRYRVPIQQAHVATWREVSKESHRKRAVSSKRNTASQIARRGAKQDGQKRTGQHEDKIPEALPHAIVDVATYFQRNPAQY